MKIAILDSEHSNLLCVIELLSNENKMNELRNEFEMLFDPGPNPRNYNTAEQHLWNSRVSDRERKMVEMYGGTVDGRGKTIYTDETFIRWLLREHHADLLMIETYDMGSWEHPGDK